MANTDNTSEFVWAEKNGYPRRQFRLQNLQAMGTDPGGQSYDGWKIVEKAKEPEEVSSFKSGQVNLGEGTGTDNWADVTEEEYAEYLEYSTPGKTTPKFGTKESSEILRSDEFKSWKEAKETPAAVVQEESDNTDLNTNESDDDKQRPLAETEGAATASSEDTGSIGQTHVEGSEGDTKAS